MFSILSAQILQQDEKLATMFTDIYNNFHVFLDRNAQQG